MEDYFTEIIGFLLNKKELSAHWIKLISKGEFKPKPKEIKEVATQYNLGKYGRADLFILWTEENKNRSLLTEHKIFSPIGERGIYESGERKTQISNYISYQTEIGDANDHKIAIFKLNPQQLYQGSSPHFLGEFTWEKFDEFINDIPKFHSNPEINFLCNQISIFMRRFNMVFQNFTF